nr:MAG TPA: preprotein translocase subunit SecY [Caudoviricetes sp.]
MKWIKTKQVRNRVLFTLLMLSIFEFGTFVTLPGIKIDYSNNQSAIANLMNLSSGGSLSRLGLLALGASPYVTASILVQLFSKGLVPYYKKLSMQGVAGQMKLAQHTRLYTFLFGILTAVGILYSPTISHTIGVSITADNNTKLILSIVLASGGLFVSYIGSLIDEMGIGNGQSNIIAFGILTSLPGQFYNIYDTQKYYTNNFTPYLQSVILAIVAYLIIIVISYFANKKEYTFPLQSKNYNVNIKAHYLPVKLLASSVMPIIFASSLLAIIGSIGQVTGHIWTFTDYSTWAGILFYSILIFVFSYLYNLVQIDSEELTKNLRESSMYIKGVTNENVEKYINNKVIGITNIGAPILTIIAITSLILEIVSPIKLGLSLTGINILILVGVIQDICHQIAGLTAKNNYQPIFKGVK